MFDIFHQPLELAVGNGLFMSSNFHQLKQETMARRAEAWSAVERSLNSRLQVPRHISIIKSHIQNL